MLNKIHQKPNKMSASKIKKLINDYNDALQDAEYANCMMGKEKSKKKKEELEDEEHCANMKMDNIAYEILNLNPSKYMISKYPQIQDILESF